MFEESSPIRAILGSRPMVLDASDMSSGNTLGEWITNHFNRIYKKHHCVHHAMNMINPTGINNNMNSMNQMGMNSNMNNMNQMSINNNIYTIPPIRNNNNIELMNQTGMNFNMNTMNQFGMNNNINIVDQMGTNNNNNNMYMKNPIGMNNNMNIMNQFGMDNNMNIMNQMGINNNMYMNNQMGMNNNMNIMNQFGMDNNMNIMNQMGFNNTNDINNINEINTKEKYLNYFFDFISFENKEKPIFKGKTLSINYYNLKKIYVNIELNRKVDEIISTIYWQLFYSSFKKEKHKRTEKNQTTEYIIKNPIYEIDSEECPFKYSNFLYLEFNNMNISNASNITGEQLGLLEGSEIFLKIKKEFYDEIITFPKIPVTIFFDTKYCQKETEFPINPSGMSFQKFSQFFDVYNYSVTVSVDGWSSNVKIITSACDLVISKKLKGAGCFPPLNFVDVEKEKIKNLNISQRAPKWRKMDKGLNIFGICNNSNCEAFKKEVIYMTKLSDDGLHFNLNEKVTDIRCPICNKIITPKTCGFYDSEYQFVGKKIDNGDIKEYDSKTRETMGNNFEYFDTFKNGEIVWIELNIYVLPKQNIKYSRDQNIVY